MILLLFSLWLQQTGKSNKGCELRCVCGCDDVSAHMKTLMCVCVIIIIMLSMCSFSISISVVGPKFLLWWNLGNFWMKFIWVVKSYALVKVCIGKHIKAAGRDWVHSINISPNTVISLLCFWMCNHNNINKTSMKYPTGRNFLSEFKFLYIAKGKFGKIELTCKFILTFWHLWGHLTWRNPFSTLILPLCRVWQNHIDHDAVFSVWIETFQCVLQCREHPSVKKK